VWDARFGVYWLVTFVYQLACTVELTFHNAHSKYPRSSGEIAAMAKDLWWEVGDLMGHPRLRQKPV